MLLWRGYWSRVTRWVFLQRNRPNSDPALFLSKWIRKFYGGKASLRSLGYFCNKKTAQKETFAPWAKIRPIWGQCYDHNFLRFLTIFCEKIGIFLKN
jgi:hypothetical protein